MDHTPGQAIEFIEKAFGQAAITNHGLNAAVVCPFCAEKEDNLTKKKLVIRTDDFLCHCWVCGYRSTNLMNLLSTFRPHLIEEYREKFKIKQPFVRCFTFNIPGLLDELSVSKPAAAVKLPHGFTLMATNRGVKHVEEAWRYLKNERKLTEADLWLWKFGVTDKRPATPEEPNCVGRVIVPSFNAEGNLNYFSARAYWKNFKGQKYTNPEIPREDVIFNEINIDWSQELTLVEGVFDLVKCNENATCLLGSTLDQKYKLFQKIVENQTPVLLALDNDAHTKAVNLARLFSEYGVIVRIFHPPQPFHDVGQMSRDQFIAESKHAKLFSAKDYLLHRLEAI